jgi:flagellar motor switch protein FliM/flagellar basal body-associated protein FliL
MAAKITTAPGEADDEAPAAAKPVSGSFVGRLMGGIKGMSRKQMMIYGGGALLLIGGIYGGLAFMGGGETKPVEVVMPKAVHHELPEMMVNLSAGNDRPQYLRVKITLELEDAKTIEALQPVMPRVLDTFQVHLRELRAGDLEGSAGIFRLREELTRRVNHAIAPRRRAGAEPGRDRQSARLQPFRTDAQRQFRHSRHHRLGDGVLRAPADARNRLRPAGAADDDELRNFTSDNVEVSLDRITSVRFGDYLNSIPLPAILAVFKAEEWDNFGLFTVDSSLIYSMIDVLLGGRRGQTAIRVEGRPYTTIETGLVKRMIEVCSPTPSRPSSRYRRCFNIDRLETNPRFAAISRPANAAILVRLRIDMEDRGGAIEMLLPYATIEPIRDVLLQMFMGEKFGRDPIWEGHLATEIGQAEVEVDAVLYEAEALVKVRCGSIGLTEGRMGRVGERISVRVANPLRRPRTTLAMFENAGTMMKRVEAT